MFVLGRKQVETEDGSPRLIPDVRFCPMGELPAELSHVDISSFRALA